MNFNKDEYLNRKCVIFPGDYYRKEGYIRNIDDLGYTYEVVECINPEYIGVFFRNHTSNFEVQFIDE